MSKEEYYRYLDKEDLVKTVVNFSNELDIILKENIQLQRIIKKAIEYIEQEEWDSEYDNKLLKILKGESDESN
jgi:hypothetical protein